MWQRKREKLIDGMVGVLGRCEWMQNQNRKSQTDNKRMRGEKIDLG
jgi:hypothetical protein